MRGSPYWPSFLESSALIPEWIVRPPFGRVYDNILGNCSSPSRCPGGLDRLLESIPPQDPYSSNLISEVLHHYQTVSHDSNGAAISSFIPFQLCIIWPSTLRGFWGRASKQKHGNFRFLSPRAGIEMWITLLESPELTWFNEMTEMSFGTLFKNPKFQLHQYPCWVSYVEWNAKITQSQWYTLAHKTRLHRWVP